MDAVRPAPTDYRVVSFDCYGTLIDWETGIWDALQPLLAANSRDDITRDMALRAFAHYESEVEGRKPTLAYPQVLASVHSSLAGHFELKTSNELANDFGESVPCWPAFADTADALRSLRRSFRLVILSNVDRKSFAASNRKLGVEFDAVYTAEDIGSYKPNPANFEHMLSALHDSFAVERSEVLHAAQSLFHDHVPAISCGLATAWIDRQRVSEGGEWGATPEIAARPSTTYVFLSMAEMASNMAGLA